MKTGRSINLQNTVESLRDWQIYFIIVLVGIIVFGKSIAFEFTFADDTQLLVVNQELLSNLANIPKLFTTEVFISMTNANIFYRPILNLIFMFEMQIAKDSPLLFHITNILLHLCCSVLVYVLLKRMQLSKLIAIIAALLFCVHPLNTSAVVWIPGRNDTLMTLCVLSSFLLFLKSLETKRITPLIGHLLLYFIAILTKETAIVLPILCFSYIYFVKGEKFRWTISIPMLLTYIFIITLWFVMRGMVSRSFEVHQTINSLALSWLSNLPVIILYFGKVFLPFNLSIFPNMIDQSLLLGLLSILLFIGLLFIRRPDTFKMVYWGLGWFFLFLAPTLIMGRIFHEHRAYCSFIGLLLALAHFPLIQKIDFSKIVHVLGVVGLLVMFVILTIFHAEKFRNRFAYVTSAFASAPSIDESYVCLAGYYIDEGNDAAAEQVIYAGIISRPNMVIVHRMLADIYARRKEYTLAAREYETALRVEPLNPYTYINYGKMCLNIGKIDAAVSLWKTSVLINPEFLLGYYYIANYYINTKSDPDSAMIYVRELQQHGVTVLPELLQTIERHPSYRKKLD